VGKEGVSEALLKTAETELTAHELVKVKVLETAPDDPKEVAEQLAKGTSAHVAQVLGRTLLIFRADPKKPRIQLVSGRSEG
jgi:RNA-binding protein